ncbi:MAG: flagellar hook-associated protein 3 [Leptospiraceae bacterium]|nr:flagellar hook-associated protein 3 [Leptospiraceae bacterium]
MIRTTDIMKNSNLTRNLGRHSYEMDKVQNQLATGRKIRTPGDDPSAATNQMYFRTRVNELEQFEQNLTDAKSRLDLTDGELARVTDIMQRVRELTVQAANGVYQGDDGFELKNAFAKEIDQHLRALIEIGNGRDATGRPLFGGHRTGQLPFQVIEASLPGLKGVDVKNWITDVQYQGDIGRQLHEVERSQYIDINLPGSKAFWGTNTTVTSTVDANEYVALAEQSFKIDGVRIDISAGDRLDDVIDKINRSGIEVRASRVGQDNISLHSTSPHQIWLEDSENGTVLRDLGLISSQKSEPPNNYAESAITAGASIFDTLIKLRNDLLTKDQLEIGGRDLANLDSAIQNVLRHRADIGARQNRVEEHEKRVSWDQAHMQELMAKSEGIDFPETITKLKWLETIHQYALNVGARVIGPQLLDYLR